MERYISLLLGEIPRLKQQMLSGYERGIMKPPLDIAKNIAEKCNTSIDWLCGLSKKINYDDSIKTYGDAIQLLHGRIYRRMEKMKGLYDNLQIDDNLYNLWIEKTIRKYDAFLAVGDGWEAELPE